MDHWHEKASGSKPPRDGRKKKKGIVYVDENCYGPDGPFPERPGWQQIGDAASALRMSWEGL